LAFVLTFSLAPAASLLFVLAIFFSLRGNLKNFSKLAKGLLFFLAVLSILLPLLAARGMAVAKQLGESYSGRAELAVAAGKMFSEKPLLGIGLNNFSLELPQKNLGQPSYWRLQPVHNIFLLSLSETGLAGFLALFLLCYLAIKKASPKRGYALAALLFVLLTGFFDHYWLTLQQNQLLLAITLGLSFKNG
jgi:O-antigen ligase